MKLSSLNNRDRRAVTIGGVLLVPALLFVFVVKPYAATLAEVREQTAQERDFLKREKALAKRFPTLPEEKAAASTQLRQEAARLFTGDDELMATGSLAEYIALIADRHGVQLQQSETRNALPVAQGVQALQVEVRADGDVYSVLHFLQELETGDKLIRIGRLSIERGAKNSLGMGMDPRMALGVDIMGGGMNSRGGVNAGTANDAPETLTLSASVYGYRLDGVSYTALDSTLSGAPSPFARVAIDLPSVNTVLERNPFDPLRQAPNTKQTVVASDTFEKPPEPVLRLVGTVVLPQENKSFAICNIGRPGSQIVRIGERINGFILKSVMPKQAVFITPAGGQITLRTATPGQYATSSATSGARPSAQPNAAPNTDIRSFGSRGRQREQSSVDRAKEMSKERAKEMSNIEEMLKNVLQAPPPPPPPPPAQTP